MFGNAGAKAPTDAGDPPGGSVRAAGGQAPVSAPISSPISSPISEALSAVPPERARPTESSVSLVNSDSVGNWLDQLPERSWDLGPGE
ncbi:hypothetical protein E3T28_03795 [Cryobacterium sinapicolor]|uniref:Uncharacterized protein n=1 Tax=Cryobacterium sinapicolor TaxID=1259236 RepID=A0ABY2JE36_9MICO|nr:MULTISPECIES: hypothetical protein [Cryobacterium]TFC87360.1 hypothetical protein E3O67_09585 [Cryobacterium sp. TMT3-29-2]TFD03251.1 hypothetical protein E3T28_03795 [Cryobacterium sinapicolor]